ncbi:gastrula zinc finger protein XlCGF49.1-like [Brachionichthys hirsutus]|uniref:gastrula zinc finger protein XlCGF49.1-like n=1 Tax=Brachionichthys hirsutus TaxID=412623 RepID=UPI0036048353
MNVQAALDAEEHGESPWTEAELLSAGCRAGSGALSISLDQDHKRILSVGVAEEPSVHLLSINGAEEAFSTYIIPIEEDDDDLQILEESQQEPLMNDAAGSGHDEQQTLPSDVSQTDSALGKGLQETARDPNGDKFTCPSCGRSFSHGGALTRHMKSHRSTFCNICKQYFPKRQKMTSHTCVPSPPAGGHSRSCELCGKAFANQSALRIHYVVHTGEKPYRCSLCGKRFTQKGNLKCHLRIHTGERPFRCGRCGKTFTQKVNLNHHLTAHK